MKLISIYYKEENNSRARAEVIREDRDGGYSIHYYHATGDLFKTESYEGKSLQYVEDAAENWTLGIKVLNG